MSRFLYVNLNDLFGLKLDFISMIFIIMTLLDFKKVHNHISKYQLRFYINWSTIIKWLNFALWKWPIFVLLQAPTLKYYIFWSGNITEIPKEAHENAISWKKTHSFQDFLKTNRTNSHINYQKLVHNIYIIFNVNISFPIMKQMQVAC